MFVLIRTAISNVLNLTRLETFRAEEGNPFKMLYLLILRAKQVHASFYDCIFDGTENYLESNKEVFKKSEVHISTLSCSSCRI